MLCLVRATSCSSVQKFEPLTFGNQWPTTSSGTGHARFRLYLQAKDAVGSGNYLHIRWAIREQDVSDNKVCSNLA